MYAPCHYTQHFAFFRLHDNILHPRIFRVQYYPSSLRSERLDRRLVADERYHGLSVPRFVLSANHNKVAAAYPSSDHAVASGSEHEQFTAAEPAFRYLVVRFILFHRRDRLAARYRADLRDWSYTKKVDIKKRKVIQ